MSEPTGIKACAMCGRAFFGTPDDMVCNSCEDRYLRTREKVREYLWHQPGQTATLDRIAKDLNIPDIIVRILVKDPFFDKKEMG